MILVAVVLVACAPRVGPGSLEAQTGDLLYVCNQEGASISVIDLATGEVVRTIDLESLGFGENAKPHHIAVESDGSFWYVSLIGANKVLKFDRQDRLVGQVDFETPGMLAVHPSADWLFVGRSMTAVSPPARLGIINRSDMSIEEVEVVFPRPHMLAADPQGRFVHTASLGENQIMTMAVADQGVTFTSVEGPHHVLAHGAVSPDGATLVVSGEHTGKLLVFDLGSPSQPRLARVLDVNPQPWHLVFSPDGHWLYFGNQLANTVTAVDTRDWVTKVIGGKGLAEPHGATVSRDGRYLYVSNRNLKGEYAPAAATTEWKRVGNVAVIDTRTLAIVRIIEVGPGPSGIEIIPGSE